MDDKDERGFLAEGAAPAPKAPRTGGVAPDDRTGHRERLRERFRLSGADGLADYELLELLLFSAFPRRDTKPIAKALLRKFGSFAEVLGAPEVRLREVEGVGAVAAATLKIAAAAASRMVRSELAQRPVLSSWTQVLDYCKAAMAFETREQFRILFLDKKNVLIADEIQGLGTVDHTPVYPREVVRRALELAASALILVHNHPSGDPTPSRADIDMTQQVIQTAKSMGIAVHDHIIIGKSGHSSLKGLGLM